MKTTSNKSLYLNTLKVLIIQGRNTIYDTLCKFSDFFYTEAQRDDPQTSQVVAECIGKLASVNLADHVTNLNKQMQNSNPNSRRTIATGFKYLATHNNVDQMKQLLTSFMKLLTDSNIEV